MEAILEAEKEHWLYWYSKLLSAVLGVVFNLEGGTLGQNGTLQSAVLELGPN